MPGAVQGLHIKGRVQEIAARRRPNGDDEDEKALIGKMNAWPTSSMRPPDSEDRLRLLDKIRRARSRYASELHVFSTTDGNTAPFHARYKDATWKGEELFGSDAGLPGHADSFDPAIRGLLPAEILVGMVWTAPPWEFVFAARQKVKVTVRRQRKLRNGEENAEEYLYKYLESIKYKEELTRARSPACQVNLLSSHKWSYDISHKRYRQDSFYGGVCKRESPPVPNSG